MLIAAVVAAVALTAGAPVQKSTSGIAVRAVRFWTTDTKRTAVLGMIEVPYALATPIGNGPTAFIAYDVGILVRNPKGELVHEEHLSRHALASERSRGATGFEQLQFAIKDPGSFTFVVSVKDSATGRVTSDSIKLDSYSSAPAASDLVVANEMHLQPITDTSVSPGEIARGYFRFVSAPVLQIDPTRPNIAYLIEGYSSDATEGSLKITVTAPDGGLVFQVPPRAEAIPAGGGMLTGKFSLEGLPPGQYVLKASLTVKGTTVERQAPFVMADVEAALARSMAQNNASRGIDEVYFGSLPEDSLDAYAEVLVLLPNVNSRTLATYKKDELSLQAKRRFLIDFWAPRDPNKNTPENEARIIFYQQVGYANAHYGEHGRSGWKTDRGKIVAKYGLPDDSLKSSLGGRGIPYMVWRQSRGKPRWWLFGDRANNGSFVLLKSSDNAEPGTPNYLELVTIEASWDIAQWLGLDKHYFEKTP